MVVRVCKILLCYWWGFLGTSICRGGSFFLMQTTRQEEFSKSTSHEFIHVLAVIFDLIGNEQTFDSLGSFRRRPPGLGFVVSPRQMSRVVLKLLLFSRQFIDPPAHEFQMFFQVRLCAHIQAIQINVRFGSPVLQHGTCQAWIRALDGEFFKQFGRLDEIIFSVEFHGQALVGQSKGLEEEISVCGLERIVQNDDGIGRQVGLIRKLVFEDTGSGVDS
mmetsp:Transcript_1532/g.2650  ORF Transcript_1532/g.2650 Transcript_1532/m.2650 type:complete len:218 (-) Transcript_1532:424-1077(-)